MGDFDEMKKVLYITNIPAPYRIEFFNELSKSCDLTVAFERNSADNRNKDWKSGENYRFHSVFMKSKFRKIEGAFCPEIISIIKEYAKETIIVGGYSTPTGIYSIFYMKLHQIPFWLNCDGGMIKADNRIKRKLKSFFIGAAVGWLSTGKISDEYLIYYGAKREKIYHYPFTSVKESDIIKINQEEKVKIKKELGIQEEKVILFVGSFIYRKGIDDLIRASRNISNVALVLVGGSGLLQYQEILDEGMKCMLYVPGFKKKEELKLYYQVADIFVLPTRGDVWGLVVNEAMACGLPVLTTDKCVAGLELVEDGVNGYIVSADNPEMLGDRIRKLLLDDVLREKMGQSNLEKIKEYTIEKMAEEHKRIFWGIE